MASFRVDVSRGIVQDWVIGFQRKHTGLHVIDEPTGGGAGAGAGGASGQTIEVQGRSANCSKRCRSDEATATAHGQLETVSVEHSDPQQPPALEDWSVTAVSDWLSAELDLPAVAAVARQHAVDGGTAAAMLREDWREIGASGFESAKVIAAVTKLLQRARQAPPPATRVKGGGAAAVVEVISILSESEEEIQLTMGGERFLIDKDSGLAFRVLGDDDMVEAGLWDEDRRTIDLDDSD